MTNFPDTLAHPSGTTLELVPDEVLVYVTDGPTATAGSALDELGLIPLTAEAGPSAAAIAADPPHSEINNSEELIFARTPDGASFDPHTLDETPGVTWASPVYKAEFDGTEELLAPSAASIVVSGVWENDDHLAVLTEYGLVRNDAKSEFLGSDDYFDITDGNRPAYEIRDELSERLGAVVRLEFVPVTKPTALVPNDPLYPQQWNMTRIGAGGPGITGWDMQRGAATVTVAVIDEGVDLNHPDLVGSFLHNGINLGTMNGTGAPTGNHGTPCAGLAAAPVNNGIGTAGVAGGSRILPLAVRDWTDVEIAAGIRYATAQGARVISMSFGWNAWNRAIIDPAIAEAHAAGVVLVAATHNHNTRNGITYPATHPLVIAVGASDQADNRKSPASPDGEPWGANFGPQISVVAPGVLCPAPDRVGTQGYSANDYTMTFNGTSAATPQVAGLAALLISRRPSLSNVRVREIIEQSAAKVGTLAYTTTSGYPNGTWNEEMGYGRIDVVGALNLVPRFDFDRDFKFNYKWLIPDKELVKELYYKRLVESPLDLEELIKQGGKEDPNLFNNFEELIYPQFNEVVKRLEQVETQLKKLGEPFISAAERPDLGRDAADSDNAANRDTPVGQS